MFVKQCFKYVFAHIQQTTITTRALLSLIKPNPHTWQKGLQFTSNNKETNKNLAVSLCYFFFKVSAHIKIYDMI